MFGSTAGGGSAPDSDPASGASGWRVVIHILKRVSRFGPWLGHDCGVWITTPGDVGRIPTGGMPENARTQRWHRLTWSRRHGEALRPPYYIEAAGFDHAHQARDVRLPPPRPALAVEERDRAPRQADCQRQVDRVDHHGDIAADASHSVEGVHRVTQVQKDASDVDEVEHAVHIRV